PCPDQRKSRGRVQFGLPSLSFLHAQWGAPLVSSSLGSGVTTDLLSEWTDPDTAMEAVGNTLGAFDDGPSPIRLLRTHGTLRDSLDAVLRRMADGGALETRSLADGRHAYRWAADLGTVSAETANGLVTTHARPPAAPAPAGAAVVEPAVVEPADVEEL